MPASLRTATFDVDRNPAIIAAAVKDIFACDERAFAAFAGHAGFTPTQRGMNRRQEQRRSVKIPVSICPVLSQGQGVKTVGEATAVGIARDLSSRGVGFAYDSPLHSRLAMVEFDLYGIGPLLLLAELRWAKKRGDHDYLAGARLVGLITEVH